jgi:type VI protein secretion system component VasK
MSLIAYAVLVFAVVALAIIWVWCIVQIVARPDMPIWTKALLLLGTLVFPIVGAAAFLLYVGNRGPVDATEKWEDKPAEEIEEEVFRSENMTASERMDHLL